MRYLLVVQLNDSGESVALTTVCAQLVVRSTDVNSTRLPNRRYRRIGQNVFNIMLIKYPLAASHKTSTSPGNKPSSISISNKTTNTIPSLILEVPPI